MRTSENTRPRVVACSRRTDIPAFYTPWLLRRLEAGFCHVLNPQVRTVSRVSLMPEDVAVLGFFTRDPRPLLARLDEVLDRGHVAYAHMTMNGYGPRLEPRSPGLSDAVPAFVALSERLGADATVWRYDPIVLSGALDEAWHERRFAGLAARLQGHTRECYVSFIDGYRKTERNMAAAGLDRDVAWEVGDRHGRLVSRLAEIAEARGITLRACAEPALPGVRTGSCVDAALVARLRPGLALKLRSAATREGCGCSEAVDIGGYDTCPAGCVYCYATADPATGRANRGLHDAGDTILHRPVDLLGKDLDELAARHAEDAERGRERRATGRSKRGCDGQMSLFDDEP